jgi:hypothetical protein
MVLCLNGCESSDDPTLEETSDNRYPVDSNTPTISVTNRDGSISIYGAGGDVREVRVEMLKKAYSPERLKAISTRVTTQQNSISIEAVYPPDSAATFSDRSGTVDLVIVVPQAATISKLELRDGEVLIEELRSKEARAQLGNGRFFVHNCFGNLDFRVQTGIAELVYDWWEKHDFSIRAAIDDGNAFAYLPEDAVFHLIANAATGKIANDFQGTQQRRTESTNHLDVMVDGAEQPKIEFETRDGNIRIAEHNP